MSATVKTEKAPRKQLSLPKLTRSAGATPSTSSRSEVLVVGGEPRVHLLPPQVHARKKSAALHRKLGLGVIGMLVIVGAGFGLANLSLFASQAALASQQNRQGALTSQASKYSEVTKAQTDVASIGRAQQQATAQEILWSPVASAITNGMPSGGKVVSLTFGIDSPFAVQTATTTPLQGPHVATVTVVASMPQSQISGWVSSLSTLKGFVDAVPGSVTLVAGGNYNVSVAIHLGSDALSNRFATKK